MRTAKTRVGHAADEPPILEPPVDFAFLRAQTFGDVDLERDVLQLFVEQARRVVPSLPQLGPREQADAAHLLKGSARGIGARHAAAMAEAYEQAGAEARPLVFRDLAAAFAQAEVAIAAHGDARDVSDAPRVGPDA